MSISVSSDEFLARLRSVRAQVSEIGASTIAGRRAAEFLERIEARLSNPPRIAVLGEMNCGKSTFANRLIGDSLLSTDLIRNTRAPVMVRRSDAARVHLRRPNGDRLPLTSGNISHISLDTGDLIEVCVPFDRLASFEVIDTPAVGFDEAGIARAVTLARLAHVTVWCTLATQAWRASEVAFWSAVRARVKRPSVLVVTQTDVLDAADRDKVRQRLVREAGPMFGSIAMTGDAASTRATIAAFDAIMAGEQARRCGRASEVARRFAERIAVEISERAPRARPHADTATGVPLAAGPVT